MQSRAGCALLWLRKGAEYYWPGRYAHDGYIAAAQSLTRPLYPAPAFRAPRSVTYAVCNTLAGHYNSFGVDAPLPKKRKERLAIEITDAEKLLARGR